MRGGWGVRAATDRAGEMGEATGRIKREMEVQVGVT